MVFISRNRPPQPTRINKAEAGSTERTEGEVEFIN
jgi:hypothetical protein